MPRVNASLSERFWAKVDRRGADDCWVWTGCVADTGYGRFKVKPKNRYAHRVSLALSGVNIPPGMHVDHLCENKLCVNPAHLDLVTAGENFRRSRDLRAA